MSCSVTTDLTIQRGASLDVRIAVVDAAGAPIDITGSRIWMAVHRCDRAESRVLVKDSDTAGHVTIEPHVSPTEGEFVVHLVPADTSGLTGVRHLYEIWLELPSGDRYAVVPRSNLTLTASLHSTPP